MQMFLIFLAFLPFFSNAYKYYPLPAPYTEKCIVGLENHYDPSQTQIPWYTVDLDAAPIERWTKISKILAPQIQEILNALKNLTDEFFGGKIFKWVDDHMKNWDAILPQPYQDEIKGISAATGIPLGEIVLYNLFYDLANFCTSIVAEDPMGNIFHARNMDFGEFMGWNIKTHEWKVTEALRGALINVEFRKNNQTLYKAATFAGFIGIFNAMKEKKFSLTANQRFMKSFGKVFNWLTGDPNYQWMTFATREAMETSESFDEAVAVLSTRKVISGAYFIIGGTKSGEGVVVSRDSDGLAGTNLWMNSTDPKWYVLQTNYDHWKDPLFIDDRRTPGNKCMQILGQSGVGFEGIYNVLSSKTNLNKATAFTLLMQVKTGRFESYVRHCPDPCWPF